MSTRRVPFLAGVILFLTLTLSMSAAGVATTASDPQMATNARMAITPQSATDITTDPIAVGEAVSRVQAVGRSDPDFTELMVSGPGVHVWKLYRVGGTPPPALAAAYQSALPGYLELTYVPSLLSNQEVAVLNNVVVATFDRSPKLGIEPQSWGLAGGDKPFIFDYYSPDRVPLPDGFVQALSRFGPSTVRIVEDSEPGTPIDDSAPGG